MDLPFDIIKYIIIPYITGINIKEKYDIHTFEKMHATRILHHYFKNEKCKMEFWIDFSQGMEKEMAEYIVIHQRYEFGTSTKEIVEHLCKKY